MGMGITPWRDGMGRLTIKAETGASRRSDIVLMPHGIIGVCRAPGWVIVQGQASVNGEAVHDDSVRERIRSKARRHWWQKRLPPHLRDHGYGPPTPDEHDDLD